MPSKLEITYVPLTALQAASYNPRSITDPNLKRLTDSLTQFGVVDPIIARRDGLVIGGHQRLKAAQALGLTEVPVIYVDLDDTQAKALNVALNTPALQGEWDNEKLAELLTELQAQEALTWTGFEDKDLETLLARIQQPTDGLTDPDAIPEQVEPITQPGDLWLLGKHRLLCGDSTKAEDVAKLLDGAILGAMLTDPPYGMGLLPDWSGIRGTGASLGLRQGIRGHAYPAVIGDDAPFDPSPIFTLWGKDVSEIFLFGADYYAERIPRRSVGSWLVWDKRKESQSDGFGSEFELIWSQARHKRRVLRHEWFGFLREGEHGQPRSHPTQKPVVLLIDIIDQWIKGDMIGDPYVGSGTTIIAAERLGRTCYAMEIDPHYCDVAVQRWESFTGQKAVKE